MLLQILDNYIIFSQCEIFSHYLEVTVPLAVTYFNHTSKSSQIYKHNIRSFWSANFKMIDGTKKIGSR